MMPSKRTRLSGADLRVYRADSWIERADRIDWSNLSTGRERRGALDDKFTAYWIAFSALYGQAKYRTKRPPPEASDLRTFLRFVERTPLVEDVRQTLRDDACRIAAAKLLEDRFLDNEHWAHWDAEKIIGGEERRTSVVESKGRESDVIEVFLRLYVVRNQLFHGCATRGSSSKGKTTEYAVTLLHRLLPLFVKATKRYGQAEIFLSAPPYPPSESAPTSTPSTAFNPPSVKSIRHG